MENQKEQRDTSIVIKLLGLIILVGASIFLWYLAIPAVVIWYLYKKDKSLSPRVKLAASVITAVVFLSLGGMATYANRAPTLTISEPQDNASIQAASITVRGTVSPKTSILRVNELPVSIDPQGNFSYEAKLADENNNFSFKAENGGKQQALSLTVVRVFTPEEQAERQAKKAAEEAKAEAARAKVKADREAAKARKEAEEAEWLASPAGRACAQHPSWTKTECQGVVDNKIWIGMTYDMLVYRQGKPDSANPSNYGSGTQWQWCWHDVTPSCYYDNDGDGRVDSYN